LRRRPRPTLGLGTKGKKKEERYFIKTFGVLNFECSNFHGYMR
jgi:hypothetical protein